MNAVVDIKKGLEGVVVDSTSISLVDGEAGRLYYRGHPIERLVKQPFAAVAHLVVFGELPNADRLREFEEFLWDAGRLPAPLMASLESLSLLGGHPMAVLQSLVPLLAAVPPSRKIGRDVAEQEALHNRYSEAETLLNTLPHFGLMTGYGVHAELIPDHGLDACADRPGQMSLERRERYTRLIGDLPGQCQGVRHHFRARHYR